MPKYALFSINTKKQSNFFIGNFYPISFFFFCGKTFLQNFLEISIKVPTFYQKKNADMKKVPKMSKKKL